MLTKKSFHYYFLTQRISYEGREKYRSIYRLKERERKSKLGEGLPREKNNTNYETKRFYMETALYKEQKMSN